jgi:hypothetical protein
VSGLPFRFPILTIPGLDPERWWELVNVHASEEEFTKLDRHERKVREEVGRVLVDADGRSWRVLDLTDRGIDARGPWRWFWAWVFGKHRVEYEISAELGLPFKDIKDNMCAAIRAKPDSWRCDEAIAGEDGEEPRDEQEMLEELIAKIRGARDPLEIIAAINAHGED